MFKYKLRNAAIDINSDSYIEDYLYRLGVRKVESFTDAPGDEDELSPFLLNNIKEVIVEHNRLYKQLMENRKIEKLNEDF